MSLLNDYNSGLYALLQGRRQSSYQGTNEAAMDHYLEILRNQQAGINQSMAQADMIGLGYRALQNCTAVGYSAGRGESADDKKQKQLLLTTKVRGIKK